MVAQTPLIQGTDQAGSESHHAVTAVSRGRFSRRALLGGAGALAAGGALSVTVPGVASVASTSSPSPPVASGSRAASLTDPSLLPAVLSIPSRRRLVDYEVVELVAMLRACRISSVEVTQAYLDRIDALNGPFETYGDDGYYNVFVRINADAVRSPRQPRPTGPWPAPGGAALPFRCCVGSLWASRIRWRYLGFITQDGSPAFAGNVALQDATVVARLRAAGVVLIGNTICSAFSGSITGTFAGNAWNPLYVPGGSSQGSWVAPIARLAAACIAEETGGSIMMPSAANGGSGIKPSLGTVSIAGLMPLLPRLRRPRAYKP